MGGVRRCEHGGLLQSVVPQQILYPRASFQADTQARICMLRDTWKQRKTQRQEEQRPPIRVWSVWREKNVEPSKYEQFVTRMVELRGPRTTRENACIPFVIFLFQKISLKWSADSAGEGGWMCATEHEFHCGHGARRSLQ